MSSSSAILNWCSLPFQMLVLLAVSYVGMLLVRKLWAGGHDTHDRGNLGGNSGTRGHRASLMDWGLPGGTPMDQQRRLMSCIMDGRWPESTRLKTWLVSVDTSHQPKSRQRNQLKILEPWWQRFLSLILGFYERGIEACVTPHSRNLKLYQRQGWIWWDSRWWIPRS